MKKLQPNPMLEANIFSKISFWWLNDMFKYGYNNTIEESDMFELRKYDSSYEVSRRLEKNWIQELNKAKTGKKPSLVKAMVKTYYKDMLLSGIMMFFLECCRISVPLLMGGLLEYFENIETTPSWIAYAYAAGISISILLFTSLFQVLFFYTAQIGWHVRTAICSLMYKKTLRLSHKSLNDATTGKIVNLSSTDVLRFDMLFFYLHFLWLGPAYIIAIGILLWYKVGMATLAGVGGLIFVMILQTFVGINVGAMRSQAAVITDGRIRLMNEIIAGMRIIKMYVWEKPFAKLVDTIRKKELRKIFHASLLMSLLVCWYASLDKVLTFVTVAVYISLGGEVLASKLFPVLNYYQILGLSGARGFSLAIGNYFSARVSLKRIQAYLLLEEVAAEEENKSQQQFDGKSFVDMKNYSGRWREEDSSSDGGFTLEDITVRVDAGQMLAVIGPVGSGKSSILSAILSQLPTCAGLINVNGEITFANQVPWVFSGTVKENILFGEEFDEGWFNEVIQACDLTKDIESFPNGNETLVSERGVTLSGGQKARVNLARAVYRKDASICLLDDPLSAVDAAVGNHIFQHCISGLLKDKVCILVTHQLYFLKKADKIIILKEGKIAGQGTYDELQADGTDFAALLQKQETEEKFDKAELPDFYEEFPILKKKLKKHRNSKFLASADAKYTEETPLVHHKAEEVPEELRKEGSLSGNVYVRYFTDGMHLVFLLGAALFTLLSQSMLVIDDWWISYWTDNRKVYENSMEKTTFEYVNQTHLMFSQQTSTFNTSYYLTAYGIITGVAFLALVLRSFLHFYITTRSSRSMHNNMFNAILRTPIRFFDTNPVGRILNRFSKDLGQIDESLPFYMIEYSLGALYLLSSFIILCVVNYFAILFVVPLLIYIFIIRKYYLRTMSDVKRLEGITRSPVFSLLSSTLDGLQTIRAMKVEKEFEDKFHRSQDLHGSVWFVNISAIQWLTLRTSFASGVLFASITFISVVTAHLVTAQAGLIGLTLMYAFAVTNVTEYTVNISAEVDTRMTSVERIQQYCDLPPEADDENPESKPPADWPTEGSVAFENLSFAYYGGGPTILKDITLKIKAYEKIGIVGRTGAGKSSLISALFRLAELTGGEIFIDGIPITPLGLNDLRKVISIIPQDPVLFTGTMRYNLDPFSHYKDEELWNALEQVQLKEVVESLPLKLSSELAESGSNFSVGQRQLVCLARAVLRKSKILVIDEATANVDLRTDRLIQLTIREKFKHCTVLTIAHRLNTIIDSDRVMVMDEGEVKEFDEPYVLLQDSNSYFSKLAEKTKNGQLKLLLSMAEEAHMEREDS